MGKSKEISQDLRKNIVDLHKFCSALGAISKRLKVPRSSVQTIVRKHKHHGTTQPSYRSGRRRVLSPRDGNTLVQKVQINPRTTAKDLVKMLKETGTKVSKSTVKRVLYWQNLKDWRSHCSKTAQKKPDYGLQLHMGTKIILFGGMSSGLMKQKYNCFSIMTIVMFGRKRGSLASRRTPSQPWSTGVAASCCGGALLQEGLVHFTK